VNPSDAQPLIDDHRALFILNRFSTRLIYARIYSSFELISYSFDFDARKKVGSIDRHPPFRHLDTTHDTTTATQHLQCSPCGRVLVD
jgi:hypothetical protein